MDEFRLKLRCSCVFVHLIHDCVAIVLLRAREGRWRYAFHLWVPEQHVCGVFKESPNCSGRTIDKNAIYQLHNKMPISSYFLFLWSLLLQNARLTRRARPGRSRAAGWDIMRGLMRKSWSRRPALYSTYGCVVKVIPCVGPAFFAPEESIAHTINEYCVFAFKGDSVSE